MFDICNIDTNYVTARLNLSVDSVWVRQFLPLRGLAKCSNNTINELILTTEVFKSALIIQSMSFNSFCTNKFIDKVWTKFVYINVLSSALTIAI